MVPGKKPFTWHRTFTSCRGLLKFFTKVKGSWENQKRLLCRTFLAPLLLRFSSRVTGTEKQAHVFICCYKSLGSSPSLRGNVIAMLVRWWTLCLGQSFSCRCLLLCWCGTSLWAAGGNLPNWVGWLAQRPAKPKTRSGQASSSFLFSLKRKKMSLCTEATVRQTDF